MNNKLTPVLSVSITNFKTSNNTLRSGFFLLEAALSLLLCIALSGVLVQYKTFIAQLHSARDAYIKNLYDIECAAFGAVANTYNGIPLATAYAGTLTLYSSHKQTTHHILGFFR